MVKEKLEALVAEKFQEEGFEDCFLVELQVNNKKVVVFIDSDSGITFKKCQRVSRHLEAQLDEHLWLGEEYTIEVSSPGVGKPLVHKRQYPRQLGRKMEVVTLEGEKYEGIVTAVEDNHIAMECKMRIKEGKRKKVQVIEKEILFADIKKAKVLVSFSK